MRINIDVSLKERSQEYVDGVVSHIESRTPFVIYHDEENYMVAFPSERRVTCYAGGYTGTNEIMKSDEAFIQRIQLAIPVYEKFESMKPKRVIGERSEKVTIAVPTNLLTD